MIGQTFNQEQKSKKKNKKWIWVIGGFALLIIIIASIGGKNEAENKNTSITPATNKTEEVNTTLENTNQETSSSTNEAIKSKIITRDEIINLFSDFNFSKGNPVGVKENYVGKSNNGLSIIQLIGDKDSLSEISIANSMDSDSVAQMETLNSYVKKLTNELTPNIDKEFPRIELTSDTTISDGFEIKYQYVGYGSGVYSETYTFKPI